MDRFSLYRSLVVGILALGWGLAATTAYGDQEKAVLAGIQFLRGRAASQGVGETAMVALALIKADTPQADPVLAGCLTKIRKRFTGSGYEPERRGGQDIYEAAVVAMVLANLDSEDRSEVNMMATFLLGRQNPNGSWDYTQRKQGDTSISQYAILGLWECQNAGIDVSPSVWDRAASWYLSVQAPGGSWNYHRDQAEFGETMSMTAAGVGSLLICKRQLEAFRQGRRGQNPLLKATEPSSPDQGYEITTSLSQIDQAVKKGIAWLGANFTTSNSNLIGQSVYYGLYGIERIGALSDRQTIGKVDWFERGRTFLRASQKPEGAWHYTLQTDEMNTVWAVLFLTKSTAKSIRRNVVRKLGAGTLVGGRYLPKDLTSMTVAGGHIMSRPMNGAVEGMITVLEDPRAQDADTAVSGMVERYYREGPEVLRPFKDRFRKMLADRDPGLREVGAWALSKLEDLDVIPALIEALTDPEERVVISARLGLQLLSRKIDGLGPPSPSTPEERQAAAERWRAWYETIRPLKSQGDEDDGSRRGAAGATPDAPAPRPRSSSP